MNQQVEVKAEEKNTPEQNQNPPQQVSETTEQNQLSETNQVNWRKFREQKEIERKQRLEAERIAAEERAKAEALKSAMEALLNKPATSSHHYPEDDETEEQKIDKRVEAAIAQREAVYEKQRIQREQAEFPQRLTSTFNDFNQVCNTENLDYLEYHYPEVSTPFKHMPDGFDKWAAIYKAVKRFVPNPDSKKEAQKADKNFNKPQSISSTGTTQGGNAMTSARLDEAKKAENWARMQKSLKGLS